MMFDLNEMSNAGGSSAVFNSGKAGKVENVRIEVTKRRSDEPENQPDYRMVFTDENGSQINQGFYYHKNNPMYDDVKNQNNGEYLIRRILEAAKAVVPEGFTFPDVKGKEVNEIVDLLFNIIREHQSNATVNVFASYGTKTRPDKYLKLRYFNFVEKTGTAKSRLFEKGDDLMERLTEDTPQQDNNTTDGGWGS